MKARITIGGLNDDEAVVVHENAEVQYQGNTLSIYYPTGAPNTTKLIMFFGFLHNIPPNSDIMVFYGAEGTGNPQRHIVIEPLPEPK